MCLEAAVWRLVIKSGEKSSRIISVMLSSYEAKDYSPKVKVFNSKLAILDFHFPIVFRHVLSLTDRRRFFDRLG